MSTLDLRFGFATIPHAGATTVGDDIYPAGWVLPGGQRTDDRDRAMRVAESINRLINERAGPLQQPKGQIS